VLAKNHDLFAWTIADMSRIDPRIISHKFAICKEAKPLSQKKRKIGEEKRLATDQEMQKLLDGGFIREVQYTTWLANVVLVKKNNGQ